MSPSATKGEIKRKKLEAGKLRTKFNNVVNTIKQEIKARWHDESSVGYIEEYQNRVEGVAMESKDGKSKLKYPKDPRVIEANDKLQLYIEACEVLLNDSLRQEYDRGKGGDKNFVKCYSHQGLDGKGVKNFFKDNPATRKRNGCYFCSQYCVEQYFNSKASKTPKAGPNNNNAPCTTCKTRQATD